MKVCHGFRLQTMGLFAFFFCKSVFGLVTFFTKWRLSLFCVKLCSVQKFRIGYNIIHYSMDMTNTHSCTIYSSCS